jgi:hypothetical protein
VAAVTAAGKVKVVRVVVQVGDLVAAWAVVAEREAEVQTVVGYSEAWGAKVAPEVELEEAAEGVMAREPEVARSPAVVAAVDDPWQ